jgi:hypothetical protein
MIYTTNWWHLKDLEAALLCNVSSTDFLVASFYNAKEICPLLTFN